MPGSASGKVERFELPNLGALNFLLHESLGGGGTRSLKNDAQGKTLEQRDAADGTGNYRNNLITGYLMFEESKSQLRSSVDRLGKLRGFL